MEGRAESGADPEVEALRGEVGALREEQAAMRAELADTRTALRYVGERSAENRRRLWELRRSAAYEDAFTAAEPLVTVIVPTYDRAESLRTRSVPSALAQTYRNLEVVVVGDQSPPEVAAALESLEDERVRFYNRAVRGPYPEDPDRRWFVLGTAPYNDALGLARGQWIAGVGDDDSLRPDHVETLLRAAQENRYEHCYGRLAMRYPSGEDYLIGEFPPRLGHFALQSSIYHAGLSYFELEPPDYLHSEPNDFSLCRRMLEAGVRFGMVEDVVADKYESRYESPADWERRGTPRVD
jgi:glycosyltransferase involved in cell wall biosynthesis